MGLSKIVSHLKEHMYMYMHQGVDELQSIANVRDPIGSLEISFKQDFSTISTILDGHGRSSGIRISWL